MLALCSVCSLAAAAPRAPVTESVLAPSPPPAPAIPSAARHFRRAQASEGSNNVSTFQFLFTDVRISLAAVIALAEVALYDGDGLQIAVAEALNPHGQWPIAH